MNTLETFDKEVAPNDVVTPTPEEDRPLGTEENVTFNRVPTVAIIDINSDRVIDTGNSEIVDEILRNHIPLCCPIASRVQGTGITRFSDNIVNLIAFDPVFVSSVGDG